MTTATHDLLLFDLDGTLSDPLLGVARSMNYALAHFGHEQIELPACSAYVGPPLDQSFAAITGVTSADRIKDLVAKYRERYADVGFSENNLYPGVREMLARLAEARIPLAVCTTKRADLAERILEFFGIRGHFLFVRGGDIGIDKQRQLGTLLTQGFVSASSLMIGDRKFDLSAARQVGICSAGVLWGYGSRSEIEDEKPNYVFASPTELTVLVRAGQPKMNTVSLVRPTPR